MNHPAVELPDDPGLRRANELDALAGILPAERREALAALLTENDVTTLKHLAEQGMGANTLRALASDLGYLEGWALAATGLPLPWPAPEGLALKFLAHHLWDPVWRDTDPSHGMPEMVAASLKASGLLRAVGPHAPGPVRRRLANWATLHRWRGLAPTFASPAFKTSLKFAVRASARPPQRKSQQVVTRDVLDRLLATCVLNRLVDRRDRALLLTAFASGGRRRSELASLRVEQLETLPSVPANPRDPASIKLSCLAIRLGRTKRGNAMTDLASFSSDALLRHLSLGWTRRGSAMEQCFGRSTVGAGWTEERLAAMGSMISTRSVAGWQVSIQRCSARMDCAQAI